MSQQVILCQPGFFRLRCDTCHAEHQARIVHQATTAPAQSRVLAAFRSVGVLGALANTPPRASVAKTHCDPPLLPAGLGKAPVCHAARRHRLLADPVPQRHHARDLRAAGLHRSAGSSGPAAASEPRISFRGRLARTSTEYSHPTARIAPGSRRPAGGGARSPKRGRRQKTARLPSNRQRCGGRNALDPPDSPLPLLRLFARSRVLNVATASLPACSVAKPHSHST